MKYIDLDFFQPERDRIAAKRKKMIPLLIVCSLIFLLTMVLLILHFDKVRLNEKLVDLTTQVTNLQTNNTTLEREIQAADSSISDYEDGKTSFNPLGMQINDIQAGHLRSIMASTPNEAFYTDIIIKDNVLTLNGYTKNTQIVAKIGHNLEDTNYFDEVVISNVVKDEHSGYLFTINAFIKE